MRLARRALALALTLGCNNLPDSAPRPARSARVQSAVGAAVPVAADPHGDASTPLPLEDPHAATSVGRAPRRVDIDQLRASLESVVGARWTGPQRVRTPEVASGSRFEPDADLLEFFAEPLGRPNWVTTTAEVLEPTVTFAKLARDAVRSVCAAGLRADLARAPSARTLLVRASPSDALPAAEARVRENLAHLALRFWGEDLAPDAALTSALLEVFRVASTRPGATTLDGWRAVCIDLASDPRFLSY